MSSLRSIERNAIKNSGSASTFKERWNTYRTEKFGEGNVPKNTMKKKQVHYDSSDHLIGALEYQKSMVNAYMENKRAEKEAEEVTAVTE